MKTKLICVLVTLAIIMSFFPQIVFANEVSSQTYTCNGFTVDYKIIDSWGDSQNITVTITNISSKSIENWMLAYDFCGEITNLWNGTVEKQI